MFKYASYPKSELVGSEVTFLRKEMSCIKDSIFWTFWLALEAGKQTECVISDTGWKRLSLALLWLIIQYGHNHSLNIPKIIMQSNLCSTECTFSLIIYYLHLSRSLYMVLLPSLHPPAHFTHLPPLLPYFCMSHCSKRTMEGSLLAASLNSSSVISSLWSLSILLKILSTRCCGVSPSSFIRIMITVPTIL